MSQQTESSLIRLSQPGTGQTVSVPINAANMRLSLGFAPDPGAVDKNGQNLEFSFENGAKLVLEGYYDHFAGKTLPVMVTENGDELPGEDFLASLREDLLTAAGPGAGAAAGSSGAGEYADDAGALVDGVARLGSLGTIYWDQETGVPEEATGDDLLAAATAAPVVPPVTQPVVPPVTQPVEPPVTQPVEPDAPFVPEVSITVPDLPGEPDGPTSPEAPHYYLNAQGYNLDVEESFMPGGTNGTDAVPVYTMAFLIIGNDDLVSIGIGGQTYPINGETLAGFSSVKDKNGSLSEARIVDNGDGTHTLTFTYTQGQTHTHGEAGNDTAYAVDAFEITVNTVHGASASITANVNIIDDIPALTVTDNDNNVTGMAEVIVGTWAHDFGADQGVDYGTETVQISLDGGNTFIDAAIDPNGNYSHTFENGDTVVLYASGAVGFTSGTNEMREGVTIDIKVIDADGDFVQTGADTQQIIFDVAKREYEGDAFDRAVDETNLTAGSGNETTAPNSATTAISNSDLADGWSFTGNIKDGGELPAGLTWNPDTNTFTYELQGPVNHGDDGNNHDAAISGPTFTLEVKHADGSISFVDMNVAIHDDGPSLTVSDNDTDVFGRTETVVGAWAHDFGADQGVDYGTEKVEVRISGGTYEEAVKDADGNYTVTLENGDTVVLYASGEVGFVNGSTIGGIREVSLDIKVTDADGDFVEEVGAITLNVTTPTPQITSFDLVTDDSALAGGAYNAPAQAGKSDTVSKSDLGDGWSFDTTQKYDAPNGSISFDGDGNLIYTQTSAYSHQDPDLTDLTDELAQAGTVLVWVMHTDGTRAQVAININIYDDAPTMSIDATDDAPDNASVSYMLGSQEGTTMLTFTAEGHIDRNYGADQARGGEGEESITITYTATVDGKSVTNTLASLTNADFDATGKATVELTIGVLYLTRTENGIEYTYMAVKGTVGDTENITLSITDADGDTASVSLGVELNYEVPAGITLIDEAGLDVGSHHPGWFGSSATFAVSLEEGTESIGWDLGNMPSIRANAGDGYTDVEWSVDSASGNLIGTVGDTTVIEVSTDVSAGKMTVTMFYPMEHSSGGDSDTMLGLMLPYTPILEGNVEGHENNVYIGVKDDYSTPLNDVLITTEPTVVPQNVYLVLDCSGSMYYRIGDTSDKFYNSGDTYMKAALLSMIAMVEKYVAELGSENVIFSLIEFSCPGYETTGHKGVTQNGVDAETFLAYLKSMSYYSPNATSNGADNAKATTGGTDYHDALTWAQVELEADQQDPSLVGWDTRVYFISDGKPDNAASGAPDSWQKYVDGNGIDVIAVGINLTDEDDAQDALKLVGNAGDSVINVTINNTSTDALTEALKDTIEAHPLAGNLFANDTLSADGTVVTRIWANNEWHTLVDGEVTVDLGNGIKMTVHADGGYSVVADTNITDDVVSSLKYEVMDGDGDVRQGNITLTVRDARPEAFDNVATMEAGTHVVQQVTVLDDCSAVNKADFTGNGWILIAGQNATPISDSNYNTKTPINWTSDNTLNPGNDTGFIMTAKGGTFSYLTTLGNIPAGGSTHKWLATLGISVASVPGVATTFKDCSIVSKTFDLAEGATLQFNWQFKTGGYSTSSPRTAEQDAAFYVIKDAKGNIVDSGMLAQSGPRGWLQGVVSFNVPADGKYTLSLVVMDLGGNSATSEAQLFIGDIVVVSEISSTPVQQTSGNVLTDPGVDGTVDFLADKATLKGFEVAGVTYTFDADTTSHTVEVEGGTLVFNALGEYSYIIPEGAAVPSLDIKYTLVDQDGDESSAFLYIRDDSHILEGTGEVVDGSAMTTDNNILYGTDEANLIYGSEQDDVIYGGGGNDVIHGGDGDDVIYGGDGNDTINGGAGNDTIYGGDGNDTINGGAGDDLIYGGLGNDILYGDLGKNVFAWSAEDLLGTDTVMDFKFGQDLLRFDDLLESGDITLDAMIGLLQNNTLGVSVDEATNIVITHGEQTVVLAATGSDGSGYQGFDASQLASLSGSDEAAKAETLMQILSVTN